LGDARVDRGGGGGSSVPLGARETRDFLPGILGEGEGTSLLCVLPRRIKKNGFKAHVPLKGIQGGDYQLYTPPRKLKGSGASNYERGKLVKKINKREWGGQRVYSKTTGGGGTGSTGGGEGQHWNQEKRGGPLHATTQRRKEETVGF